MCACSLFIIVYRYVGSCVLSLFIIVYRYEGSCVLVACLLLCTGM
ncbi:hypothetical protein LEMLEM_LOCUS7111 [Lemmus lemmus]